MTRSSQRYESDDASRYPRILRRGDHPHAWASPPLVHVPGRETASARRRALAGFVFLGKVYWFSIPFRGIVLSAALYAASLIAAFSKVLSSERTLIVRPNPTRIRLATSGDADAIAALSRTEIERDLSWGWTPLRVDRAMRDPTTNVIVAVEGGPLIGFGIMEYLDEVAHLQLFAVRPEARRRGVGSAILVWLEKVACDAGLACFRVEARQDNVPALAFYRKHGYRERATVPGMYEGFEDGVRLEKQLSNAREHREG